MANKNFMDEQMVGFNDSSNLSLAQTDQMLLNCGLNQACINLVLHSQYNSWDEIYPDLKHIAGVFGNSFYQTGYDFVANFPENSEALVAFLTEIWADQDPHTAKNAYSSFLKKINECNSGVDQSAACLGELSFDAGLGGLTFSVVKRVNYVEKVGDLGEAGIVTLGRNPGYKLFGESIGAKYLNISDDMWKSMSDNERWAVNQKFLDDAIARGDVFILSHSDEFATKGSFFRKELDYLSEKGYRLSEDGLRLINPE